MSNVRPMHKRRRIHPSIIVAAGFGVFIAAGLLVAYLIGMLPTPEEACVKRCSAVGKQGQMSYVYPPEITAGMRSRGPMECKCK